MKRRTFLGSAMLAGLAPWVAPLAAGSYPTRAVRVVSPYGPGGSNDTSARIVMQALSRQYGQEFVVENKPGAGTRIATDSVARSPGDGYTLLWAAAPFAINTAGKAKLQYDIKRDFVPIGPPVVGPVFLIVNADSPIKTLAQFVQYARQKPDGVTFASPGSGSGPHLTAELFAIKAGFKGLNVHYRGDATSYTELIAGRVDATLTAITTALPHIENGTLRVLAVASPARSEISPETPTFAELGFPDVVGYGWFGLIAPKGTPDAVAQQLNADVNAVFNDADIRKRLLALGLEPGRGSNRDFQTFIDDEVVKWSEVIETAGITLE